MKTINVKIPLQSAALWKRYYQLVNRVDKITIIDHAKNSHL